MELLSRIKTVLSDKKMTVADLSRLTNISGGQIDKWDKINPGVDKVRKVADVLGVSVDYLLGRTDTLYQPQQSELPLEQLLGRSTTLTYGGIELSDDEKRQLDLIIRTVVWPQLKK